jgi:hypothetical protein
MNFTTVRSGNGGGGMSMASRCVRPTIHSSRSAGSLVTAPCGLRLLP